MTPKNLSRIEMLPNYEGDLQVEFNNRGIASKADYIRIIGLFSYFQLFQFSFIRTFLLIQLHFRSFVLSC